jgi:hypothetical protein
MRVSQASQCSLGATPTEIGQGSQVDAILFGIQCATPLSQGHSSSTAANFNFSLATQEVSPQFFFRSPSSFIPVSSQQQFQFHQFSTPILSTQASHPSQSLDIPPFQSFQVPSIPMQQSRHWSWPTDAHPQAGSIGHSEGNH